MKLFATITQAPLTRSTHSRAIALFLAGLLTLMAIAQLFTFEEFIQLINDFTATSSGMLIAACVIVAEVLSLPFLLRMPLSRAFRWVSASLVFLVTTFWLVVSVLIVFSASSIQSIGFFGGLGALTPGAWAVLFTLAMFIMAAWSLWGLLPTNRK